MSKQTLKFLGRGSMFNVKEGNTAAYYKTPDGKNMLLIDCGGTIFQKICKLNLLDGVENLTILITHTHTDHVGSLPDLLFYLHYLRPDISMTIFGYEEALRVLFNATGVMSILSKSVFAIPLEDLHFTVKDEYFNNSFSLYKSLLHEEGVEELSSSLESIASNFGIFMREMDLLNNTVFDCYLPPFLVYGFTDKTHVIDAYDLDITSESYNISYFIYIKGLNKLIYYSGDTMEIPEVLFRPLNATLSIKECDIAYTRLIDEYYVDSAIRKSSDGISKYPHNNIYDMVDTINNIKAEKGSQYPQMDRFFAMHIDEDIVLDVCKELVITPVEVEK